MNQEIEIDRTARLDQERVFNRHPRGLSRVLPHDVSLI